jgi:predicted amidohydrolase
MRVAALQFCPMPFDADVNLARIEEYLAACDAALAVLPELCTTGYFFSSRAQLASLAEPVRGRFADLLATHARAERRAVVAGFAERDGDRVYNSALTVLPDGSIVAYRKIHLFGGEKNLFEAGDRPFSVVEWDGVRLGTMICYDWRFPESVRSLALQGADIICHPSDLVAEPRLWQPVMRVRAFENRVIAITADRNGAETLGEETLVFHGCSQIADVNGTVLAEADETFTGWIAADVDPARARRKRFSPHNDIFSDRRPELYGL